MSTRRCKPVMLMDLTEDVLLTIGDVFEQRAFGGFRAYDHNVMSNRDFRSVRDLVAFSRISRSMHTHPGIRSLLLTAQRVVREILATTVIVDPQRWHSMQRYGTGVSQVQLLRELVLAVPGAANMALFARDGATALMAACYCGHIEQARWLLIGGADMSVRNHSGQTARDLGGSIESGMDHAWKVDELLNSAATRADLLGGAMQVAIKEGDLTTLASLLSDPGSDANWLDSDGKSLLLVGCIDRGEGHVNVRGALLHLILKAGANVNYAEPQYGDTALHYAAANGHLELIEQLLLHGADQTLQDKEGQTPRDVAMAREPPQIEAARMLV